MRVDGKFPGGGNQRETTRRTVGRRDLLRAALGGGAWLTAGGLLTGCGGGKSGSGNPGTGNGGNVSTAQRMAALTGAEDMVNNIPAGTGIETARESVRAYLAGQPEFVRTGKSDDGCVWATFADGRQLVVIMNQYPDGTAGRALPERTRAATDSLPRNVKAYMLSGFGTHMEHSAVAIGGWLQSAGYAHQETPGADATLERLRNIRGAGVLYLATHGGEAEGGFSLSTMTKVTDGTENDPIIEQELKDGLLTYAVVPLERRLAGFLESKSYKVYGFTHKFVERYMTFAENSIVYVDACTSDDLLIRSKCHQKGASLYVGWTAPVRQGVLNRASRFVFDRLLGANQDNTKEDPAQRPFEYTEVHNDLKKRGWHTSPGDPGYGPAEIVFTGNGQNPDFALLNPSIKFVDVDEEAGTLTLHGVFGHSREKVTVAGTEIAIQSWEPKKIVCTLPLTGAGSAGDVQVEVDGHKSNVRTLSEWKTTLKYRLTGPGTWKKAMDFQVRWRADIGSFREKPGEAARFRDVYCQFTQDSTAGANGSGQFADAVATHTTSGELFLPYFQDGEEIPAGQNGFIGNLTLKPEAGVLELFLGGSGKGGGTWVLDPHGDGPTITQDFTCYFPVEAFGLPNRIPMERDGRIPGDSKQGQTFAEPTQNPAQGVLSWDTMEPRFPPRDETGRSR